MDLDLDLESKLWGEVYNSYGDSHDFRYIVKDPPSSIPSEWLFDNLKGKCGGIQGYWLFTNKNDATLFSLTWG
jgi:hypothetical protein